MESRREALRDLSRILVQKCKKALSELEAERASAFTPLNCFDLWSDLGRLKLEKWSELLTSHEVEELEIAIRTLDDRLRILLEGKREEILACLNVGISKALSNVKLASDKVETLLTMGKLSELLPSIEINADLLYWRDSVGYAVFLIRTQGLNLTPELSETIGSVDMELKELLPKMVRSYRETDDDPTPYPEYFPKSFWWRQGPW